jgi:hypothetical protein
MVAASRLSLKGGGPRADVQLHDFTCMATSLLIMQLPIILIPYILSLVYALGRPDHAVCWDSLFSFLSGTFLHLLLFFGAHHRAWTAASAPAKRTGMWPLSSSTCVELAVSLHQCLQ